MRNTSLTTSDLFDELFRDLNRMTVGFEPTIRRLYDMQNTSAPLANGYPPYDLETIDENHYRITLAVAGFTESDLDIEIHDNQLKISGEIKSKTENPNYLHRGIASRAFTRTFYLADHVKIDQANLDNGLLTIDLVLEVPEALKPRKILINNSKLIDGNS